MTGQPAAVWRFIDTGSRGAAENMAVDEALLACFDPTRSLPVLRLYGWSPPAFSCGRFQQPEETLALDKCRADGVAVVRRITGGGLLYHSNELTYSLVCPATFVPGGLSVKNAFLQLTTFLIGFYRTLGLDANHAVDHYGSTRPLGGRTPLCFAGIESCDILINGRKIGGNAQRRLKEVIFQHGSIPLRQMAGESERYLLVPAPEIVTGTTSLADEGVTIKRDALATVLQEAFSAAFGIRLEPTTLTVAEQQYATEHMQESA